MKAANADKFPPLAPFKFSLENSNSRWEGAGGTAREVNINNPHYEEISLSQWLASNPARLLADNFGVTSEVIDKLPKAALGIAK